MLRARPRACTQACRELRRILDDQSLICDDFEIRLASHMERCDDQQLYLGRSEFKLLCYLIENCGKACRRNELTETAKAGLGPQADRPQVAAS